MIRSYKPTAAFLAAAIVLLVSAASFAADPPQKIAIPPGFILQRSPIIDGVREADEWTTFQTTKTSAGDLEAGAAWDSVNLYLMVEGPALESAVAYLDVNMDGWLNGSDNYQITVTPGAQKARVVAQAYSSGAPSPETAMTSASLDVHAASRTSNGRTVVEMAIPGASLPDLKLTAKGRVAASAGGVLATEPKRTYPEDPRQQMEPLRLVDELRMGVPGLDLDLRVKDRSLVPGQTFSMDFFAKNTSGQKLAYSSYSIGGEARIADLVNYLRVRGGELAPGEGLKQGFSTDLPQNMPLGAYVMEIRFNLADGPQAAILTSFEVVELLDASLDLGTGPISPISERRMYVVLRNNKNRSIRGSVTLTLPPELAPALDRKEAQFRIQSENETERVLFKFKPTAPVEAGLYPVKAEVTSGEFHRTLSGMLRVGR